MCNSFTRIIRGGVYEKDNGEVVLILSNNQMNAISQFIIGCKIVNEDEDDLFYHVNYDTDFNGTIIPNKILLNCTFAVKSKFLKTYKYMLSDEIMKKVDIAFMKAMFGEQLYSLSEARNAIAEHELALRLSLENNAATTATSTPGVLLNMNTPTTPIGDPTAPIYVNENDIDDIQDYYGKKMMQDNKYDLFNPVLPNDFGDVLPDDYEDTYISEIVEKEENEDIIEQPFDFDQPEAKPKDMFNNCNIGFSKEGAVILTKKPRKKRQKKSKELEEIIRKNQAKYRDINDGHNYIYFLEFYYKKQYDRIEEIFGIDTDMKTLYKAAYKCRQIAKTNLEIALVDKIKQEARDELKGINKLEDEVV